MGIETYRFACGCEFEVIGPPPVEGALPCLNVDDENFPFCQATWDLLAKGDVKGIFQLESNLGKHWTKRLAPSESEHLGALGALLRPGCLKAVSEEHGVSMTELYCLRKNGETETSSFHPALDPILQPTFSVLVYQEQSMQIGRDIAGFDLKNVDRLRKAIGKKDQKELAEVRKLFLEGAAQTKVVSEEQAQEIWGWIEKSGRYQFNKAHSISYGLMGYDTAYIKAHFPTAFYFAWLRYAKDKTDPMVEIQALVNDARAHDVPVEPPDLRTKAAHFHTDGVRVVFGLADIKGVGESTIKNILSVVEQVETEVKPLGEMTWPEFLVHVGTHLGESILAKLIRVGALRWLNVSRKKMLHELTLFDQLTLAEQKWCAANIQTATSLPELFRKAARVKKEGGAVARKDRVEKVLSLLKLLENPPSGLRDSPAEIAASEASLLGIAVTCSSVDACDASQANCTCKDYLAGRTGSLFLAVKIEDFRVIKTKNGKDPGREMAFITVSDASGFLNDVVIFPDQWAEHQGLLSKGNTVLLQGERDKLKGSFKVVKVWQLREVL